MTPTMADGENVIAVCGACDFRTRTWTLDGREDRLCGPCIAEWTTFAAAVVEDRAFARTATPGEERHAGHEIPEPGCELCARLVARLVHEALPGARRLTPALADACPQCKGTVSVRIVGRPGSERRPCPPCGGSGQLVPR